MSQLVYFSSESGNTQRFVEKLGVPAVRLPIKEEFALPNVSEPYVLICPTYSDGFGQGAVPKSVIKFLNKLENRQLIRGVIATGNRNFGQFFAYSGDIIAKKCQIPVLYRFELSGCETDLVRVRDGLKQFWSKAGQ